MTARRRSVDSAKAIPSSTKIPITPISQSPAAAASPIHTPLALTLSAVLALGAGSAVAAGLGQTANATAAPKTALVIAGAAANDPQVLADAKEAATLSHADLRVVHTTGDQLGVTHLFAVGGYEKVVTVDVDQRIAIAPVNERYPDTQFISASPRDFAPALR